ncbi:flagellar motility protein MotE (MotC chaperone) [Mesorhizobium soli]|uniref:MotE family protein n=1 Tax=Pseudaminobacter soli (ex Li et al. 2025) TaxID=1295366 RepID=UPI0024753A05|nr:MotE family protein [Mesorhizobium soli]MDH6233376.1 flagellar motility protein MotE (MotC chaperone) [Mesorhizobium soli]
MTALPLSQTSTLRSRLLAGIAATLLLCASPAAAEMASNEEAPQPASAETTGAVPPAGAEPQQTEIERFCSNITDAARDRRYALQRQELETLQQDIDQRMKLLEEKRAEYEGWLKRRNDFLSKTEDSVVKIYSTMKPDAAAERLAAVDVLVAAGILMKLDARKAGVILNEMNSKAAAALTAIMASATRKEDPS